VSLLELNDYLRRVIALNFGKPLWVVAEIAQANASRGHWYLDLVEKGGAGDIVAQNAALLWAADLRRIQAERGFSPATLLRQGMQLRLMIQPVFHERYGLRLTISDIDPAYSVGQLELRRQQTLQMLQQERLLDRNRSLPLPSVLQRIAVVSSADAAGYQDFQQQLRENIGGYQFHVRFFQASVQGVAAEQELLTAFAKIAAQYRQFDCVVVLRGGGARLDLAVFDEPGLCRAAAALPLPLITGIGHETDKSILDMVAHTAQKTPTATADFLIQHNLFFENKVLLCAESIFRQAQQQQQWHTLQLHQQQSNLLWATRERLHTAARALQQSEQSLPQAAHRPLQQQAQQLDIAAAHCAAADPQLALQRGYSITTHHGKVVRSAAEIPAGSEILTRLADGTLVSTVK
jgi:exodeoxyribonuclease VII large subunit